MELYLFYLILSPFLGFLFTLAIPHYNEKLISSTVSYMSAANIFVWVVFVIAWGWNGFGDVVSQDFVLYHSDHYEFVLTFLFDTIAAVYIGITALLTFLITKFSRYYLHKEEGYKRFFTIISLFVFSIYLITLSGNFETMFVGWEVLGLSSFLLIGYYRERYLPVRNALKVYTYYRLADAGLLLAMWLCHHVWHHNLKFIELKNHEQIAVFWENSPAEMTFIVLLIGLAAAVKSAQFPFSTWLARAMEGPTPSSAIFYGSIAVNIGCFLLMRTYPLWSNDLLLKIFFVLISITTIFTASIMSRTQSNIKANIAYASIVQIGIVFIEITLGLHLLAIIHFSGNAFLRAYQLLISPSSVTYLMREQFFNFVPDDNQSQNLGKASRNTLLIAGLKEWRLDSIMYKYIWKPFKIIGSFLDQVPMYFYWLLTLLIGVNFYFVLSQGVIYSQDIHHVIAMIFTLVSLWLASKGLAETKSLTKAWSYLFFAHIWLVIGIGINDKFDLGDTTFYLGGVLVSVLLGFMVIYKIQRDYPSISLNDHFGLSKADPILAVLFILAAITMAGFPLSTTFIGEDLLFTHIEVHQPPIAFGTILVYIIEGIALMRLYTRIFLGPLKNNQHSFAKRFS